MFLSAVIGTFNALRRNKVLIDCVIVFGFNCVIFALALAYGYCTRHVWSAATSIYMALFVLVCTCSIAFITGILISSLAPGLIGCAVLCCMIAIVDWMNSSARAD